MASEKPFRGSELLPVVTGTLVLEIGGRFPRGCWWSCYHRLRSQLPVNLIRQYNFQWREWS